MKNLIAGLVMAFALAANAALWEGIKEENYVGGPKIVERDLFCKVVLLYYVDGSESGLKASKRIEEVWKAYDHKKFFVIGSWCGSSEKAAETISANKLTFPVYKEVKLAADSTKRMTGAVVIVSQYGKIIAASGMHDIFNRDHEKLMVEAIMEVGMPPNLIPGVTLDKYKSLKNKLKLGVNLKGTVKALEKDVAAAEKKTANATQKAKAEEASSILSAIKDGKSEITESINALADINPEEAFKLLSQYVKSFPDEAADNKEKLAELKTKAAEFKKQAK